MRYSGFVSRSFAILLDLGFLFPFTLVALIISQNSIEYCVLAALSLAAIRNGYFVVAHKVFGQTIGKFFLGIEVVKGDYHQKISWQDSLRRSSGDIFFSFVRILGLCSAFISISKHSFDGVSWLYMESRFRSMDPTFSWIAPCLLVWILSESVTLLFSARRQSLQDLFGGTFVVSHGPKPISLIFAVVVMIALNVFIVDKYSKIYRVEPNKIILIGHAIQRADLTKLVALRIVGEADKVIWIHTNRNTKASVVLTNKALITYARGRRHAYPLSSINYLRKKHNFGGYFDLMIGMKSGARINLRTLPNTYGKGLHRSLFQARNRRFPIAKMFSLRSFKRLKGKKIKDLRF